MDWDKIVSNIHQLWPLTFLVVWWILQFVIGITAVTSNLGAWWGAKDAMLLLWMVKQGLWLHYEALYYSLSECTYQNNRRMNLELGLPVVLFFILYDNIWRRLYI